MILDSLGDILIALMIPAAVIIFIRANLNYLPREEKIDD